jgi:subtilase family serine protease
MGADVVSNSYGVNEYGSMDRVSPHFRHPGHAIVASSGDTGYTTALFPAVAASVTAVGGTTLSKTSGPRGWTESAWGGATSGCSSYVAKPAWQHDARCAKRTVADVSAVAANLAVYDSYGQNGWMQIDGTSAAAPIVAGAIALSGGAHTFTPQRVYQHRAELFDVRRGTNDTAGYGTACDHDYLCVARPGYDAPTGWGTPNGVRAFAP